MKTGRPKRPAEELFNEKWVKHAETGCWLWTGKLTKDGYGTFRLGDRTLGAHLAAHIMFIGPLPSGWHVDHVYEWGCRHRHCVNWIQHLEAVTPQENIRRIIRTSKQICSKGHPRTADNLYVDGTCKECQRYYSREYQRRISGYYIGK